MNFKKNKSANLALLGNWKLGLRRTYLWFISRFELF